MRLTTQEQELQHELCLRLRSKNIPVLEQAHGGLLAVTNTGQRKCDADRIAAGLDHIAAVWRDGETRYFPLRTHRNRWETQADQWNLRRWHWTPMAMYLEAEVDPCHDARIRGSSVMIWSTAQNPDTTNPVWQSDCDSEKDAEDKIREFLLTQQGQRSRRDVARKSAKCHWPTVRDQLLQLGYTITAQEKLESGNLDLEPGDWLGTSGRVSQREAEQVLVKAGFVSISLETETGMIVWAPDRSSPGSRDRNRMARNILMAAPRGC